MFVGVDGRHNERRIDSSMIVLIVQYKDSSTTGTTQTSKQQQWDWWRKIANLADTIILLILVGLFLLVILH